MEASIDTRSERGVAPLPGIYEGVPAAEYFVWPYASSSRLTKLMRSPAHMRAEIQDGRRMTAALTLGSAIHTAVLEPWEFQKRYCLAPECDKRTKAGKEVWAKFCEGTKGLTPLKPEEASICASVLAASRRHSMANLLLSLPGKNEVSIVWDDPETRQRCKARIDRLCLDAGLVVDLKTTEDACELAFTRSIFNYGYYRQGAFYLNGLKANGVDIEDFSIIAMEKTSPFAVAVYRLREDALEVGRRQLERLLARYAQCEREQSWPGYSTEIEDIGLPSWALSQIEQGIL